MTTEEIFEKLRTIVSEETGVPAEEILWDSEMTELTERSTGASCCDCCRPQPK